MKCLKQIKIRIGEPLTAVSINKVGVAFGSATGYIGYYSFINNEVYYLNEIYDELIRMIQLQENNIAYCAIGDYMGLVIDFSDLDRITSRQVTYENKSHILTACPNTLPFLKNNVCFMVTFPSSYTKELHARTNTEKLTQSLYLINYDEERGVLPLGKIEISPHSVPFHFDGYKFLWMEYHDNQTKSLKTYDYLDQTTKIIREFDSKTPFISHAKLLKGQLLYVEAQKKVNHFDIKTNKTELLYQHKHQIIALEFSDGINKTGKEELLEEKDIMLDIQEEKKNQDVDSRTSPKTQDYLTIVSIDTFENLFMYKNSKVIFEVSLRQISGFPFLPKKDLLFDMGYPYFLAFEGNHIAFTSDQGLFVLEMVS